MVLSYIDETQYSFVPAQTSSDSAQNRHKPETTNGGADKTGFFCFQKPAAKNEKKKKKKKAPDKQLHGSHEIACPSLGRDDHLP